MRLNEVFSPEQIRSRVRELGTEISRDYRDLDLITVCVLKGAYVLFADLMRSLDISPEMDFIRLSSYADGTDSGRIVFSKDMELSVKNRHVLVVEDIVDTGHSMEFFRKVLHARSPESVRICSLIDKTERRQVDIEVDYPGFVLEKGFIVGYGLDYAERYRELPGIFEIRFDE
ncbi:MAG: hypoxanthine phosphoribosyltransferase [Desulfonatronovibrionaceae bacterium]